MVQSPKKTLNDTDVPNTRPWDEDLTPAVTSPDSLAVSEARVLVCRECNYIDRLARRVRACSRCGSARTANEPITEVPQRYR